MHIIVFLVVYSECFCYCKLLCRLYSRMWTIFIVLGVVSGFFQLDTVLRYWNPTNSMIRKELGSKNLNHKFKVLRRKSKLSKIQCQIQFQVAHFSQRILHRFFSLENPISFFIIFFMFIDLFFMFLLSVKLLFLAALILWDFFPPETRD